MAQTTQQKDVLGRLADAVSDLPGGPKVIDAMQGMRERLDDLQRRVRSLDPLERRVAELERRLDALTGTKPAKKKTAAAKKS